MHTLSSENASLTESSRLAEPQNNHQSLSSCFTTQFSSLTVNLRLSFYLQKHFGFFSCSPPSQSLCATENKLGMYVMKVVTEHKSTLLRKVRFIQTRRELRKLSILVQVLKTQGNPPPSLLRLFKQNPGCNAILISRP